LIPFFESLAHDQRECAIGIILSGSASDGTLGSDQSGGWDHLCSGFLEEEGHQVIQCNIRDITERKQTETALREARDRLTEQAGELERLVDGRTVALRETVGDLESFS